MVRPPERITVNADVVLRRERVDDAEFVAAAVAESLSHLAPWMSWATPDAARSGFQGERLEAMAAAWDEGRAFTYLIDPPDESSVLGGIGLHRTVGQHCLEVGYWLHPLHVGRGHATAAVGAITQAALALPEIARVEIHCDAANTRSQAIPRRLGFLLDRIESDEVEAPGETGQSMVWVFSL